MDALHGPALHLRVRELNLQHCLKDSDEQAILNLPHRVRRLGAQSSLLREGDRPQWCAVLLQGFAFRHNLTGDGSRPILAINLTGDALDFQNIFLEQADQDQLADATGLTAVHVNRVLPALQRDGLIKRDRRMVRFPNWERTRTLQTSTRATSTRAIRDDANNISQLRGG